MISATGLLSFVLYIVIIGLVFWLLFWLVDYVGIPEPFHKVAKVILAVVAVIVCIGFLLSLGTGEPLVRWK